MKKTLLGLALLATTVASMTSCSKSDSSSPSKSMTATFTPKSGANTSFKATGFTAVDQTTAGTRSLSIDGIVGTGTPSITLSIINYAGTTGTFYCSTSGGTTPYLSADYIETATAQHIALNGQLNLTTATAKHYAGTFSFTAMDSSKVTNGSFDINL